MGCIKFTISGKELALSAADVECVNCADARARSASDAALIERGRSAFGWLLAWTATYDIRDQIAPDVIKDLLEAHRDLSHRADGHTKESPDGCKLCEPANAAIASTMEWLKANGNFPHVGHDGGDPHIPGCTCGRCGTFDSVLMNRNILEKKASEDAALIERLADGLKAVLSGRPVRDADEMLGEAERRKEEV